ncbi:MAG: protein-tyrosine phosphatase family protein [Pontiella sp.]
MIDFRKVELEIPGTLLLHSMPGWMEPFEACFQELENASIQRIICLNPLKEVQDKSPEYAAAIRNETLPCEWVHFPIGNVGVPEDKKAFLELAEQTAEQLKHGENILVHCKGGVGRTGTFASGVTAALGQPLSRVTDAGGKAETDQQRALIAEL